MLGEAVEIIELLLASRPAAWLAKSGMG